VIEPDIMQPMVDNQSGQDWTRFEFRLRAAMAEIGITDDPTLKRTLAHWFKISGESTRKWLSGDSSPRQDKIIDIDHRTGVRA